MEGRDTLNNSDAAQNAVMAVFNERFGDQLERFLVPPPVFTELGGQFIKFDSDETLLIARFPIEERFLNPYKVLQGGMIAAAIDNTLGPLSMLIAPPNLTRRLEVKFSRPARLADKFLFVDAQLDRREGRRLFFRADARNPEGDLIARTNAMHWIIES
jgi:acyl-coenzyme A thioesterase PaaI-like protein